MGVGFPCETGFECRVEEVGEFAEAFRLHAYHFGTTVTHKTFALELRVIESQSIVNVEVAGVPVIIDECRCLYNMQVVVVTENITFAHHAVGVVEVVLYDDGVVAEITLGKLVDVYPLITAQQVVDRLVVHAFAVFTRHAGV